MLARTNFCQDIKNNVGYSESEHLCLGRHYLFIYLFSTVNRKLTNIDFHFVLEFAELGSVITFHSFSLI